MMKLIVAFHNFVHTPKKERIWKQTRPNLKSYPGKFLGRLRKITIST
jgi:hypothetical protein